MLTEWAVSVDMSGAPDPFFAAGLTDRDVARIGKEAGGLPWAYRRNGTLTAFNLKRATGDGTVRFARTNPRPTTRPPATPRLRAHQVRLPLEFLLLGAGLALWAWLRTARRRKPHGHLK